LQPEAVVPEVRFASCNGERIAYQVVGDGPIDMVFMSAWFSHVDGRWEEPSFARMLSRFAGFARLIVFDKRGSGASDPLSTSATTWEDWADDIRTVMDAVGSEKAAIVGVGDSGPIAMLFAATHPERVSALVVANTSARATKAEDYPWGRTAKEVVEFLDAEEHTWGTGGMLETFSPSKAGDPDYRRWWARYQRMAASPGTSTSVARLIFQMDVRPVLKTIQAPTLVAQRRDLPMVSVEHGRYLGEHIPNAKYVEVPGSDYFIYLGGSEVVDAIEEFLTGVPPELEPDRVLATVVITDIVGSTDRAVTLGDRQWLQLLDSHDDLVRRKIEDFRGRIVKTTGDGMLATFDGPARAIRSSLAMRSSLEHLGIAIRSGLHTGEIELRGDDVGGIGVHIGSRIAGVAAPHDILCSRTVKDLTVGSGIAFEDRGVHELRGVPEPWRLFAALEAPSAG
jgi:pimeloyl-ACP methyl ester carboxylesterase/class 3 adenylate cyclase